MNPTLRTRVPDSKCTGSQIDFLILSVNPQVRLLPWFYRVNGPSRVPCRMLNFDLCVMALKFARMGVVIKGLPGRVNSCIDE